MRLVEASSTTRLDHSTSPLDIIDRNPNTKSRRRIPPTRELDRHGPTTCSRSKRLIHTSGSTSSRLPCPALHCESIKQARLQRACERRWSTPRCDGQIVPVETQALGSDVRQTADICGNGACEVAICRGEDPGLD